MGDIKQPTSMLPISKRGEAGLNSTENGKNWQAGDEWSKIEAAPTTTIKGN